MVSPFENLQADLPLQPGWVKIKAVYSVAVSQQPEISSLVGQIVAVDEMVTEMAVGDAVIALAPLKPFIRLPFENCQKLRMTGPVTENMAFWALALALVPCLQLSELEIGEQVLVLGNDLVGAMLTDLAWLSGAGVCIGVNPAYADHFDSRLLSEPAQGLLRVGNLATLETLRPGLAVDLLIDASGDSLQLEANMRRVRALGRILTMGRYHPSRFDFNVYTDLHKRSLRVLNVRMPASLQELSHACERDSTRLNQSVEFVQHLFERECLQPAQWPVMRRRASDQELFSQTRQSVEPRTMLIEW